MTDSAYTVIAEDPGDIAITFTSSADSTKHTIPLKSFSIQKTTDVTPEYGTGSHEKYGLTQGKIDYKGDFEIGTWWVSSEEEPSQWMDLIKKHLTFEANGLSREFTIVVTDTALEYNRTNLSGATFISGNNTTIMTLDRCLLTGDSLSVGNVGSTASTKYSFVVMRRTPK